MRVKLSDLERKKLLHKAIWPNKPFTNCGLISECDAAGVPIFQDEVEDFELNVKRGRIPFKYFL